MAGTSQMTHVCLIGKVWPTNNLWCSIFKVALAVNAQTCQICHKDAIKSVHLVVHVWIRTGQGSRQAPVHDGVIFTGRSLAV